MTTNADRRRYAKLQELGCIVSRKLGLGYRQPDIHHLAEGHKRLGNQFTIPLSPWFHRGVPPDGLRPSEATEQIGFSLALDKRKFVEAYGTERALLAEVDALIASGSTDSRQE